jgi:two-component system, NarL family, response regulator YdfI
VIRAFIVAASPLARAGLENLLAARKIKMAGSDATVEALAGKLSDAAPDVVLVDSSGEAFELLLDSLVSSGIAADFRVVILADAVSTDAMAEALRAGVHAVLPGDISPDQLAAALHAAASGLIVQFPEYAIAGLPKPSAATRGLEELAEPLTPREREVLQMLAGGLGNKEIAARMNISEHTVKFHVGSILGKLGAGSRTEAVSIGIRRGLVLL